MTRISIIPATPEHAAALAPTMRPEDLAEVQACGHATAKDALDSSLAISTQAWAWLAGDEVAALFGFVSVGEDTGIVWFLTGHAFPKHARRFIRQARQGISELLDRRPILGNFIDARYSAAIRWAQWLGFEVGPPVPYGPLGLPFHPAIIRRQ